jgi:hypothetical protein
MKKAVKMDSGAIPNFIKTVCRHSKVDEGIHRHTDSMMIA